MEKVTKKMVRKMNEQLYEIEQKRKMRKLKMLEEKYRLENKSQCPSSFIFLSDNMLCRKKYDVDLLEKNINSLSIKTLLYTQDLTPEFCVKYILNDKYASCVEDTFIRVGDVLNAQRHITKKEIYDAFNKLYDGSS
jgi:hypothetical protein